MSKKEVTISLEKANSIAMIITVVSFLGLGGLHLLLWRGSFIFGSRFLKLPMPIPFVLVVVALSLGIIIHELIHGMVFALSCKGKFKSVTFGIKGMNPYCHCKERISLMNYVLAIVMPCILLGVVPAIVGLIINEVALTFFGILQIGSASGDLIIMWLLRGYGSKSLVEDHPEEVGCLIYDRR